MKITPEQLQLLRKYVYEEEETRYQQDRAAKATKVAKESERARDLAYSHVRSEFDLTGGKPARSVPFVVVTDSYEHRAVIIRTDGTPLVADLAEVVRS